MRKPLIALAATALLALTGCAEGSATYDDKAQTNTQLNRYQDNQPVPLYDWSQYRQTVIDVQEAQVHGVATTTFFYNMGSNVPIKSCPSIGFPVPSTTQLTSPDQFHGSTGAVTALMEASGVYTGDSTGTYVVCVSDVGTSYVTYWEGFVYVEGAPATYDAESGQITLTGVPTVTSTTQD